MPSPSASAAEAARIEHVRARSLGNGVEIEVDDEGEGIPPESGDRVFEAVYRGDSARADGGAGLGLAISKAVVEAHGGRI